MMPEARKMIRVILLSTLIIIVIITTFYVGDFFRWCDLSNVQYSSKDPSYSLACAHKRISGRRFSPLELGAFRVGMLLIVYTKIHATYKGHKYERTFLLYFIRHLFNSHRHGTSKRFEEI